MAIAWRAWSRATSSRLFDAIAFTCPKGWRPFALPRWRPLRSMASCSRRHRRDHCASAGRSWARRHRSSRLDRTSPSCLPIAGRARRAHQDSRSVAGSSPISPASHASHRVLAPPHPRDPSYAVDDFIDPIFIIPGRGVKKPIAATARHVASSRVDESVAAAQEAPGARHPRRHLVRRPGQKGRRRLRGVERRRPGAAGDARDQGRLPRAHRHPRRLLRRIHQPWPLRRGRDGDVDNDATLENLGAWPSPKRAPARTSSRLRG